MTARVLFECVPSRLPPWPQRRSLIEWADPTWSEGFPPIAIPTEEHLAEVLELNPALKGWGEPL